MPESAITTLFLDIGGVLLTNAWDRAVRKRAAEKFGLDFEEMNERHHLTFDTYEEGKLTLEEYLDRVIFHQDRPFSRDVFKKFMFDQSKPLPEMIQLVRQLKARHGLKTVAVSNEGRELTVHRVNAFELGTIIDIFVCSCFVHFRKPDIDMFRIALDLAQTEPGRVLYLDDRAMFVEVARTLGIRGLWHETPSKTKLELWKAGLSAD